MEERRNFLRVNRDFYVFREEILKREIYNIRDVEKTSKMYLLILFNPLIIFLKIWICIIIPSPVARIEKVIISKLS